MSWRSEQSAPPRLCWALADDGHRRHGGVSFGGCSDHILARQTRRKTDEAVVGEGRRCDVG